MAQRKDKMLFLSLSVALLIISILLTSFWLLVPFFLEKPKFLLLLADGPIQVRNYNEMVSAEIITKGDRYGGLRAGFIPLASYIGAKQRDGEKISMTAPVMQQMDQKNKFWKISFFMPSKFSLEQLPPAIQNDILLAKVPSRLMAVISFNGVANDLLLDKKISELKKWVSQSKFELLGEPKPIYAYYNDPSTPGFFRKNEIMLPLSK